VNDGSVLQLAETSPKDKYTAGPFTPGSYFYACSVGKVPFGHCLGRNGTNVMRLRVDVAPVNATATDRSHDGSGKPAEPTEPTEPTGTGAASSSVQRSVAAVVAAAVAAAVLLL
jgi:hypothetical protein